MRHLLVQGRTTVCTVYWSTACNMLWHALLYNVANCGCIWLSNCQLTKSNSYRRRWFKWSGGVCKLCLPLASPGGRSCGEGEQSWRFWGRKSLAGSRGGAPAWVWGPSPRSRKARQKFPTENHSCECISLFCLPFHSSLYSHVCKRIFKTYSHVKWLSIFTVLVTLCVHTPHRICANLRSPGPVWGQAVWLF